MSDDQNALIPTSQVRARYGRVSHMWIERKLKSDPTFPRPVYIATRRYWRVSELAVWELALATRQSPAQVAASRAALDARCAA
jgi:hypothetical protein